MKLRSGERARYLGDVVTIIRPHHSGSVVVRFSNGRKGLAAAHLLQPV